MFDRYISINDRKLSNTNDYLINRFASIVWKNSIVRQISITKIVMVAPQRACRPLHYGIRAMGAMTLRNLELCPSFSPHPNISDGNFNLDHHFFRTQIFQIHEKGAS